MQSNFTSAPWLKRWAFRVLAIGCGLLPLLAAEGLLRLTSLGLPSEVDDPFVGFSRVEPLFVPDSSGERFVTNPARKIYFRPESFAAEKSPGEFRIYCLGGSTVQGRPFANETSFTTWLELSLQAAAPDRDWEVVNVGGISYASYRLVPLVRELLHHQPDLFVLYTGHNEFLEDRTYRDVKETAAWVRLAHGWSARSRLYNFCRRGWLSFRGDAIANETASKAILPQEVDAILDYYGGLADYHRDDDWRAGATEHYAFNLTQMINLARGAQVPVILVNPVSNLRDCPPFKVESSESLTEAQRDRFQQRWDAARQEDDLDKRTKLLEEATAIDGRMAAAQFALAKCYDIQGRSSEARAAYLRAKDEDICPLRMTEEQHAALREVARRTETPLVDARGFFEEQSRDGIPGEDWLLDHVHPSINGHQEIATLLLNRMQQMGFVRPQSGWESQKKSSYLAHLESLDGAYFVHGQQRLEGLLLWTQGRAEGRGRRKGGGKANSRAN